MCRPLAPGRYNVTFSLGGFANETRTVDVPEEGTGVKLTVFLQPLELGIMKWGLARRFGPLNGLRSAQESPQVGAPASGIGHACSGNSPS